MVWSSNEETWVPGPGAAPAHTPPNPEEPDWAGRLIDGRYEIVERLGGGNFGNVFRAHDRRLGGTDVAIKIVRRDRLGVGVLNTAVARALFENERQALADLALPGVVRISDCGVARAPNGQSQPYIVSEFVSGQPLRYPAPLPKGNSDFGEFWRHTKPCLDTLDQVLAVLAKVHGKGIVHGDVKPANIIIRDSYGSSGLACVVDFGCAALLRDPSPLVSGRLQGTPNYMAPEAIRCNRGPSVDQYALGVMLWRALCGGKEPFAAAAPLAANASREDWAAHRAHHSPLALPSVELAPLAEVVDRATQPSVEKRYPDLEAMRAAFRAAVAQIARERNVAPLEGMVDPGDALYPHLGECVVVSFGASQEGFDGKRLFAEVLAPAIAAVHCEFPAGPLRPVWQPAEEIERGDYGALTVERLEHARLVLWVVDGLGPRVLRLLTFHDKLARAVVLQANPAPPAGEAWHLAPKLLVIGKRPSAGAALPLTRVLASGSGEPAAITLEGLLRQALAARWPRPAFVEHWHRWTKDPESRNLVGQAFAAVLDHRKDDALTHFRDVLARDDYNPFHLQRYARLRADGASGAEAWHDVIQALNRVTREIPELAPAWRDLGVALDKVGHSDEAIAAFERANNIDRTDYDAWSAFGGVKKRRAARLLEQARVMHAEALTCYETGEYLSQGHPYPVLNAYRLRLIWARQPISLPDRETRRRLEAAVDVRQAHSRARIDTPWCDLDLAEAHLYLGRPTEALVALEQATDEKARFPFETFGDSLDALADAGVALRGLFELRTRVTELLRERPPASAT